MKRLLSILFIPFLLLTACDNWLDIVPEEDIATIDTDFEIREQAQTWHLGCHLFLQNPVADLRYNEAFTGADELVAGAYLRNRNIFTGFNISSDKQNTLNPYCDYWVNKEGSLGRDDYYTAINHCNIFIDKIDQVYNMEELEKKEWKAEVKALKAYYYFELVRHYGPIILVPENIDPNTNVEAMKVPRSHVDTCFKAIVDLCDEAAKELSSMDKKETDRRTFFSKESALALKARALLYQASDLFNGNPDYANFKNKKGEPLFSTTKDPEKWLRAAEAADAAIDACLQGGKHLVDDLTGSTPFKTHMLNIENSVLTYNYSNPEILLMFKAYNPNNLLYIYTLPKIKEDKTGNIAGTCLSPSMKMVEMFYTDAGLPLEQDKRFANRYEKVEESDLKFTDVVEMKRAIPRLHTKREPRFYAMIGADGCYWQQGRDVKDLRVVDAYRGENFGIVAKRINSGEAQNLSGYWLRKWLNSQAALMNYVGAASAFGVEPYPVIRMAELYLIAAEAWNEVGGHMDKVYKNLNVIRKRAGILDVEEAWKDARTPSLVKEQKGLRDIIRQEWNIEFAFECMRFWNLRRWKTANVELNEKLMGWNVLGENYDSFYGKGPVVVNSDNKFLALRDYFWPIRSGEIQISGCVQNPGW